VLAVVASPHEGGRPLTEYPVIGDI